MYLEVHRYEIEIQMSEGNIECCMKNIILDILRIFRGTRSQHEALSS